MDDLDHACDEIAFVLEEHLSHCRIMTNVVFVLGFMAIGMALFAAFQLFFVLGVK